MRVVMNSYYFKLIKFFVVVKKVAETTIVAAAAINAPGVLWGSRNALGVPRGSKKLLGCQCMYLNIKINHVEVNQTKIVAVAATIAPGASGWSRGFIERPYCTADATIWVVQHYVFFHATRGLRPLAA